MTAPATTPTVEDLPLEQLREWPRNPRRISKPRLEQLKRALEAEPEMLRARPLIALPDGTVVAGNQRLRAARELGWSSLPVVVVDLDEARATEWALRDNRPYGEDDEPLVGELLAELAAAGRGLDLTGYESGEVDRLLAAVRPAQVVDPDEAPPLPAEPRSVRGEVYELGPHRLMCGDATSEADAATLVAEETVACVWTDPPYGVDYSDATGRAMANDTIAGLEQLATRALGNAASHARAGAPIYVCHSDVGGIIFRQAFAAAGWELKQVLVWVKQQFVLSRQDYHWQHEPILYGWKPGAAHAWYGDQTDSTVVDDDIDLRTLGKNELVALIREMRNEAGTSVLREDRAHLAEMHPTKKPLQLVARCLRNSSRVGDHVLDPFTGSGTTLIACEQLGRRALCMEIDPAYCDVVRQRYADFVGRPELAP